MTNPLDINELKNKLLVVEEDISIIEDAIDILEEEVSELEEQICDKNEELSPLLLERKELRKELGIEVSENQLKLLE